MIIIGTNSKRQNILQENFYYFKNRTTRWDIIIIRGTMRIKGVCPQMTTFKLITVERTRGRGREEDRRKLGCRRSQKGCHNKV